MFTGYSFRHKPIPDDGKQRTLQELRDGHHVMTPDQWLSRCLFLESIAGVPGMVAAVLRHLRSLRLMVRLEHVSHSQRSFSPNSRGVFGLAET